MGPVRVTMHTNCKTTPWHSHMSQYTRLAASSPSFFSGRFHTCAVLVRNERVAVRFLQPMFPGLCRHTVMESL